MTEAIVLLVVMAAWGGYILFVERPREKRRQAKTLHEKGYGFLLDDDEKDAANHTDRRQ